jgi:hypothetical protein
VRRGRPLVVVLMVGRVATQPPPVVDVGGGHLLLCCEGGNFCKLLTLKWGILRNQYYFTSNQYAG